jgi:hypothetical protein
MFRSLPAFPFTAGQGASAAIRQMTVSTAGRLRGKPPARLATASALARSRLVSGAVVLTSPNAGAVGLVKSVMSAYT